MISIFLPSIRVHLLERWYQSLKESCNRHDFEVVLCGPYDPQHPNIKHIQDFGCPTRAAQLAALHCSGDILYHTVDDVLFYPEQISNEIDLFEDITAMRYREGQGYNGFLLPDHYWYAKSAYSIPRIKPEWGICVHFLMKRLDFIKYGGFNCEYEYLNHATHDLLFRMQSDGHSYKLSSKEVSSADWIPTTNGDHAPIHYAQTEHDEPLFNRNWLIGVDKYINCNNWEKASPKWERRFK